mgnify:FL=1
MKYEVNTMAIIHPVTGVMVMRGETFECAPGQLRERWSDAAWLARAGLDWVVRPFVAATAEVQESTVPLPVVEPPVLEQSETGGDTGEEDADTTECVKFTAEELAGMDLAELKSAATSIGLRYGNKSKAPGLRSRIATSQAGA